MKLFTLLLAVLALAVSEPAWADGRLCSGNICTGKVTCGSTAAEVGSSANRYAIVITNESSTEAVDIGPTSAVTSANGKTIAAGGIVGIGSQYGSAITASGAIYCVSSGSPVLDYVEGRRP